MGTLLLNVKTVQAFEPVTYETHTGQFDKAGSRGFLAGEYEGVSVHEIADHFGRKSSAIITRMKKLGI